MKRYGDTNTHLNLTDTARRVYDAYSPVDIWEISTEDDDGNDVFTYSINFCGDRRQGLTEDEVNAIFEDFYAEVAEDVAEEAAATIIEDGNFDAAVELMDDEIREAVHADLAPCSDVDFLKEYARRHFLKYGKRFEA